MSFCCLTFYLSACGENNNHIVDSEYEKLTGKEKKIFDILIKQIGTFYHPTEERFLTVFDLDNDNGNTKCYIELK